ncbi:FecR domain-containing protein [Pseudomonadota bacterium]
MKFLKTIIIGGLAFLVMLATVLIEQGVNPHIQREQERKVILTSIEGAVQYKLDGQATSVSDKIELKVGGEVSTTSKSAAEIAFSDNAVIRLAPDTTFKYQYAEVDNNGYVFELQSGRLWSNTVYSSVNLNIVSGGALLIPRKAGFDLEYDEAKSEVKVFQNQVNIGLVDPGYNANSVVVYQNGELINSFLVAEGGQSTVFNNIIVENKTTLARLLYSKLIKEFQVVFYDKIKAAEDSWITQNLDTDEVLLQDIAQVELQKITSRSLQVASLDSISYQLQKISGVVSDSLTFSHEKVGRRNIEKLFNHLKDAEYLFVYGRNEEAARRIKLFNDTASELVGGDSDFKERFIKGLREEHIALNFVTPDDPLFEVKSTVTDHLFKNLGSDDLYEKFLLVREYMNYVYEMAESNTLLARLSLEQYSEKLLQFINQEKRRLDEIKGLIAEENQILDNLLRQYSQFYLDSVFGFKHTLEQEWLALIPDGSDKDEEKNNIILAKIDFMKHLQNFFLQEKVILSEAKDITVRLVNEISDLQTEQAVGISELFALRLANYGQFLKFLYTTDVSNLRGVSVKEKYDEYLTLQREQVSVLEAIDEFLGEGITEPKFTVEQVIARIEADFERAKITDIELTELRDVNQKVLEVIGVMENGIQFSGLYNWDKKLISQVMVDGRIVEKDPVRLASLEQIIVPEEEEPEVVEEPDTEATQPDVTETQAEKVGKILLIQKLKKNGIIADANLIQVLNLDTQVYVVNNAELEEKTKLKMAFGLQNKTDDITNLVIRTQYGDHEVTGLYKLGDLVEVAQATLKKARDQAELEESKD